MNIYKLNSLSAKSSLKTIYEAFHVEIYINLNSIPVASTAVQKLKLVSGHCSAGSTQNRLISGAGSRTYSLIQSFEGFKIGQLNITSLVKHVEELRIFIHEPPIDILCLNETRLDNSISNSEVEIRG